MKNNRPTNRKPRWKLLHQYYSYTGFYSFVGKSLLKAAIPILIFIAALVCVHFFVIDINDILIYITDNFPPIGVLSVFFASESILGLIPPEIFIAWAGKSAHPEWYLAAIATLSYMGGILSYFMGRGIASIPSVFVYLEVKMAKHIKNMRKWGGFLIVVGALLPVPFSISSMAAGIIKFPFGSYLLFGLLRFLRFFLYGVAIFEALS
ncbi:YqaA family protein [Mesonia aestuariivivens]|uniref:Short-chain dehydrogenase n=1 Tax=Mesonia aestuariivivens TaxID=2796128 RepID=A0ABS6VYR9_9FLAO|nr:short-chain dehydrogenase [Mesonia aestuariivivens]MBW2960728.1 short-chain dehydrogenase [Mesonia aestuariivivens]